MGVSSSSAPAAGLTDKESAHVELEAECKLILDLPSGVLAASVWPLLPSNARSSLRGACRDSRQLLDPLIESASLSIHSSDDTGVLRKQLEAAAGGAYSEGASEREQWHATLAAASAFLEHLPRLHSLQVHSWSSQHDLTEALLVFGSATHHRVTSLHLSSTFAALSEGGGDAAILAWPSLACLELGRDEPGESGKQMVLAGHLFAAFTPSLTQLVVHRSCVVPPATLRSLCGLTNLQHLHLCLPRHLSCLTRLAKLPHLQSLHIQSPARHHWPDSLLPTACALSQLTRLEMPGMGREWGVIEAFCASQLSLPQFRSLSRLRVLCFGSCLVAKGAFLSALQQLTALTRVSLGRIDLTAAAAAAPPPPPLPLTPPGSIADGASTWPQLQDLCVGPQLQPTQLLQTLLALRPLHPLLRVRSAGGAQEGAAGQVAVLCLESGCLPGDDDAAEQAAALKAAMQCLAPLGGAHDVLLRCGDFPSQLSLAQVAEALAVLKGGPPAQLPAGTA